MLDKLKQVIRKAQRDDGITYPDQRQLEHLMASLHGLTGDNRKRIEEAWVAIKSTSSIISGSKSEKGDG